VGSLAVQLARHAGATVIGLASETNHPWLAGHGVTPVTYGDGVADRIRAAATRRVDAFIDTFAAGYVDIALDLGVAKDRVDTIIDSPVRRGTGVKAEGMAASRHRRGPGRAREARRGGRPRGPDRGVLPAGRGPRRLPGAHGAPHPRKIVLLP